MDEVMGAEAGEQEVRDAEAKSRGRCGAGPQPLGQERSSGSFVACTSLLKKIPPGLSQSQPCLGPPGPLPPVLPAEGTVPGEDRVSPTTKASGGGCACF